MSSKRGAAAAKKEVKPRQSKRTAPEEVTVPETMVDDVNEESEQLSGGGASVSNAETSLVAAPAKLDTAMSKRFKSHAAYNAANNEDEQGRYFASKALQLYAEGDHDTKCKILASFDKDKTYKFAATFAETVTEKETKRVREVGGWMTKFTWAAYHNIPTHDKELYNALCEVAVENLESKEHDNIAFRKLGHLLYNFPSFQVGGETKDTTNSTGREFKGETDLNANNMESKAGLKEKPIKLKIEYPEFVRMQSRLKVLESGQKALAKSINAARSVVQKMILFKRVTPDTPLASKIDAFTEGFEKVQEMEMDVMALINLCKSVAKDDKDTITDLEAKVNATITNASAAVTSLDKARKDTLQLIS